MTGPSRDEIAAVLDRWLTARNLDEAIDALINAGLFNRAPDTAPAEAAVCGLLVAEYGFLPRNNSLPRRIVRAALAASPAPTTTDAAEDDLDIAHIMTADGCKVSVNGQGHFPCKEHPASAAASSSPVSDPAAGEA